MEFLLNHGNRKIMILLIQVTIVVGAFLSAFLLRFDLDIPEPFLRTAVWLLPPLILTKLAVFWRMGLFSGWWRFVSIPDLLVVLRATLFGSVAFFPVAIAAYQFAYFPRSILILDGILCFLLMGGVRVTARMLREHVEFRRKGIFDRKTVIIVGAGAVGQTFVREIRQNPHLNMKVIGFIDSDPERQNQRFLGIPVLGKPRHLPNILQRNRVDLVIIAQPAVAARTLQKIVATCHKVGIQSKILPPVSSILDGQVSVRQIREVQVEDLLGRPPVKLDIEGIQQYLRGRRILVTGAGGSIGSEICRQVAAFAPGRLILLDHAETPLFEIECEIRERFPRLSLSPCIGDIRDHCSIKSIFSIYRPEVVFHAAAYKHVPMSECNPVEAVRNNVFGTRILADAASHFGVEKFVMISTDKAVNPTNAMGASKRAAEIYVQSLARQKSTQMVTVRFGNVLGSNGSVVPIFRRQIERGGPVTVTHPEVTRFFMTIPESVQLVLQAGSMGQGGEIFLLDMGEAVQVLRLAEQMIRLSGMRVNEDIQIVFTGLRPGEKLHEELLLAGEGIMPTCHEKIQIALSTRCDSTLLNNRLERLYHATRRMDRDQVLSLLQEIVPEYRTGLPLHLPTPTEENFPVRPARIYGLKPMRQ